jgi:hypothetical protein
MIRKDLRADFRPLGNDPADFSAGRLASKFLKERENYGALRGVPYTFPDACGLLLSLLIR